MEFNSPIYLFLFLPTMLLAYYLARGRLRLLVGIGGSLLFYAWGDLQFIPLILASPSWPISSRAAWIAPTGTVAR